MMKEKFWSKKILGIKIWEYFGVLVFYLICAISYYMTIWVQGNAYKESTDWNALWDLNSFWDTSGADYLIKLLLTIPIWWIIFRKLATQKLNKRFLLHLIGMPLFVILFKEIYYAFSGWMDWWRLEGAGQVWDYYIPSLFYCIQFGIFHAYEYYTNNQKNLRLKAALREAALNSEIAALKAQLNPHFLYNVFNTISASVPPGQEQTRELIALLSDLFRYQLKASKVDLVLLEEELKFVETYLELEKARFEDRLETEIKVSENLKTAMVPPMILQPLVENSIKHGISPAIEGGKVLIEIKEFGGRLHFKIADTGVGISDKSKLFQGGIGLNNTKLRLEKKYASTMQFEDNTPHGLIITFNITLLNNQAVQKSKKLAPAYGRTTIASSIQ